MKSHIMDETCIMLLKRGYTVKGLKSSCFDVLARREGTILLLKILEDANSITKGYAEEMGSVSVYINATPIIVSEKAGSRLENNVVYQRFGIYTINFQTFANCINHKSPFIKRSRAGLIASIIGKKMKEKREELGISLNAMSKIFGVTGRMVAKYENGLAEVTIQKAMRIYNVFGQEVFYQFDIFKNNEKIQSNAISDLSQKYIELGFDATDTKKTPFDIIAKKDKNIIITGVGDKINPDSVAVSKLIGSDNLVIFNKKKPKDIAAIKRKEFLGFEESEELIRFLREF